MQSEVVQVLPTGVPTGLVVHVYLTVPTVFFALTGEHFTPCLMVAAWAVAVPVTRPERTSAAATTDGANFLKFFDIYYSSCISKQVNVIPPMGRL